MSAFELGNSVFLRTSSADARCFSCTDRRGAYLGLPALSSVLPLLVLLDSGTATAAPDCSATQCIATEQSHYRHDTVHTMLCLPLPPSMRSSQAFKILPITSQETTAADHLARGSTVSTCCTPSGVDSALAMCWTTTLRTAAWLGSAAV